MGASRWHYFIEGQHDPQSALDELREREFASSWSDYDPSIASLFDLVNSGALEEEGAHSIIDVDRVIESDDPEYDEDGTVRLLLPQEVGQCSAGPVAALPSMMRAYPADSPSGG